MEKYNFKGNIFQEIVWYRKKKVVNTFFFAQFLCKTIIALLYTKYSAWFCAIKDNLNIFLLKSCARNRYQVRRFKKKNTERPKF